MTWRAVLHATLYFVAPLTSSGASLWQTVQLIRTEREVSEAVHENILPASYQRVRQTQASSGSKDIELANEYSDFEAMDIEKKSIQSMSFVPTPGQVDELIKHAKALKMPDLGKTSKLDSNERESHNKAGVFVVLADKIMPLASTSNGLNGVLISTTEPPYGTKEKPRINLFYETRADTLKLLQDYLRYRDASKTKLFELMMTELTMHDEGGEKAFRLKEEEEEGYDEGPKDNNPVKPEASESSVCNAGPNELECPMREDYTRAVNMFRKVAYAIQRTPNSTIDDFGLGVVSFCQTWLRNDPENPTVGHAQFSVNHPVFQTRFYIKSPENLGKASVSQRDLLSYEVLVAYFTDIMQKDYGGKLGPSFVNLDGLLKQMTASPL